MKTHYVLSALLAALVVAAAPSSATAADRCKNVKFKITNNHKDDVEIKIVQVKFTNPHNGGKEQTEVVKNHVCKPGATCTTNGDNLNNAAKVDLRNIKVMFRAKEDDDDWSDLWVTQPFTPAYPKCTDDRTYGPIVIEG
ncbi:MAG: hypothetical protein GEU99_02725 [Luteitalea sp.]|nr:hypothetical protein [Luteitalea sp.]